MRFKEVHFYSRDVERLHQFYVGKLGFEGRLEDKRLVLFLNNTLLHFEEQLSATPYHFAMNIPGNKAPEALEWLENKVEILPFHGSRLVDFKRWNAKSMYFYDPDGNIVEFISRKNLPEREKGKFAPGMAMEVSEIGMPVTEIGAIAKEIQKRTGAEIFDGDYTEFCALGDEHGLFIIINKDKKKWIPNNDPAPASEFRVKTTEGAAIHFFDGKVLMN